MMKSHEELSRSIAKNRIMMGMGTKPLWVALTFVGASLSPFDSDTLKSIFAGGFHFIETSIAKASSS